jgi:hypothetical protein
MAEIKHQKALQIVNILFSNKRHHGRGEMKGYPNLPGTTRSQIISVTTAWTAGQPWWDYCFPTERTTMAQL